MRRVLLLVAVAGLGLVVVLVVGALFVVRGYFFVPGTCTEEERKVYAEFASTETSGRSRNLSRSLEGVPSSTTPGPPRGGSPSTTCGT
jgi:hypothetical protein